MESYPPKKEALQETQILSIINITSKKDRFLKKKILLCGKQML
jgi:hypothetical protein